MGHVVDKALGILETFGLTPAMAALDAMEKTAGVTVFQIELNDFYGVCMKITGSTASVKTAIRSGSAIADSMGGRPVSDIISHPDPTAWSAIRSKSEFNPLIQQDVVFFPNVESTPSKPSHKERTDMDDQPLALGFIETQGFTAVFEAIDSACKAAQVEVVGKEKLGGGFITVVIRGEVAAVKEAIEAGRVKVDGLGKLIASHVIARPSPGVLGLLPKS